MSEQSWAQLLVTLYKQGEVFEVPLSLDQITESHSLVKSTTLGAEEVVRALHFLDGMGMVELDKVATNPMEVDLDLPAAYSHQTVKISPKGFEVAHDREQGLKQESASAAVAYLTGTLALTAIIQVAVAYTSVDGGLSKILIGVMILGTTLLLVIALKAFHGAGILDIDDLQTRKNRYE